MRSSSDSTTADNDELLLIDLALAELDANEPTSPSIVADIAADDSIDTELAEHWWPEV